MFCPRCGQRQAANDARFCPACGLPLIIVGEVLATNGQLHWRPPAPAQTGDQPTPRSRGIKQGAFMMLSTLVVVPAVVFLGVALLKLPRQVIPLAAVICTMGGLLRMLYAIFFESNVPFDAQGAGARHQQYAPPTSPPNYLGTPYQSTALPPSHGTPAAPAYRSPRRYNTDELVEPPRSAVTDHTTRLLDKQTDEPPRQ